MSRWSRPIGLAISCLVLTGLFVIALRAGEEPPDADLRNGRAFIQDNLWSTATRQYAVWVAPDGTPYAGVRDRDGGEWEVVDLGRLPGNPLGAPTAADQHNVYVLGVDRGGDVHVAGNMHSDPLRYVRAGAPGLQDWSTRGAPRTVDDVTYPAFTALPDGTLLFFRREGEAGHGAVLLDELAPAARSWRPLGPVIDGRPSGESPYLHRIAVDPRSGTLHALFEWRAGEGTETNSDVCYARSTDGGHTWETSAGAPIGPTVTHETAELVIDTPPAGSGLVNGGGLTVNEDGNPHGVVSLQRHDGEHVVEHVWLEDGSWQREQLDDLELDGRPQIVATPGDRVWLLGVSDGSLEAIDITPDAERESRELARVPAGWEVAYDAQALAREGTVELLIPDGASPRVVSADLDSG